MGRGGAASVGLFAFYLCFYLTRAAHPGSAVERITDHAFQEYIQQPTVNVVYFHTRDFRRLNLFLREYEKAASLLKAYNVKLGKLQCQKDTEGEAQKYCDRTDVSRHVYSFRDGRELLALSLENMFDTNSIMSNILQIVLLREVPIINTVQERRKYEDKWKGAYDVIFTYQKAIGTHEHRVLMEIAYAYQGEYKFALTTEKQSIHGLRESMVMADSMLWVLRCREAVGPDPCPSRKYAGIIDLPSMAAFLKSLAIKPKFVHDITRDGNPMSNPFMEQDLHTVLIYYDEASYSTVEDVINLLESLYVGIVGVVTVNIEVEDGASFGYDTKHAQLPGLAVLLNKETELQYMSEKLTRESVLPFVADKFALQSFEGMGTDGEDMEQGESDEPPEVELEERNDEDRMVMEVEKQDDAVAEAVFRMRSIHMDTTHVPALTDKTFPSAIKDAQLLMVVFFLTFDARSMAFLRSYMDASQVLHQEDLHPLASVDCFDWTDVCGKNNISTYPTIRIYRQGKDSMDYTGLLDGSSIISTIKLLQAPSPSFLTTSQETQKFVDGNFPEGLEGVSTISILGLFSSQHKMEIQAFLEAAKQMHGKFPFAYVAENLVKQWSTKYNTVAPSVIVVKRHDPLQPFSVYAGEMTTTRIIHAVKEQSLSLFTELTPSVFPAYFARQQPLVILFLENGKVGEGAHQILGEITKTGLFPHVTFCWMELSRSDGVASRVLSEYNNTAEPPALVFVDHKKAVIHSSPGPVTARKDVTEWLTQVLAGNQEPTKTLPKGDWKPLNPGYDFLKMMDEEKMNPQGANDDLDSEFYEDDEASIREELHHLRNSRLLHNVPVEKQATQKHQHTEL